MANIPQDFERVLPPLFMPDLDRIDPRLATANGALGHALIHADLTTHNDAAALRFMARRLFNAARDLDDQLEAQTTSKERKAA
jgi:hypothetical protein